MSYTTDVIVSTGILEEGLGEPIPGGRHGEALLRLSGEDWGGYKGSGRNLWAATFNYLDWDSFEAWLVGLPWKAARWVQVFTKSEADDLLRCWLIRDGALVEVPWPEVSEWQTKRRPQPKPAHAPPRLVDKSTSAT